MKKTRNGSRDGIRLKKNKFRHFTKPFAALMMAVLTFAAVIDAFIPQKALADVTFTSDTGTSLTQGTYAGSDARAYMYVRDTAKRIIYDDDGNVSYIESDVETTGFRAMEEKYAVRDSDGNLGVAYCVEAGIPFKAGNVTATRAVSEEYFKHLPTDCRRGIILALLYGYDGENPVPVAGCNADDYRFATQVIVWEYQQQLRTNIAADTISANRWGVPADEFSCMLEGRPAEKCYDWIIGKIIAQTAVPTFASDTPREAGNNVNFHHTMKYNPVTDKYTVTLTDYRSVGEIFSSDTNVTLKIKKDGNKYTFTSDGSVPTGIYTLQHKVSSTNTNGCIIWSSDAQTLITGSYDPLPFYFRLQTENKGALKLTKTSETGKISGIKFKIAGEGVDLTITTGTDGTISQDLAPGSYTVTEMDVDGSFITPSAQTVTVESGKTASVSFDNKLKRGNVEVTKKSEDNKISGIQFKLSGTSDSGEKVSLTATTGADGVARFKNVLIGTYKLEELNAAGYYIPTASQNITVKYNTTVKAAFTNSLKRGNVEVTKKSEDNKISGIKFKLSGTSDSGEKVSLTATTGADGIARFNNVLIGKYKLEELNAAGHYIPTASQNITVKYNTTVKAAFTNSLKRGNVEVAKKSEDNKISGIKFKLSGTSDSGEKVSLTATTGADGVARFKDVLVGTYTLEEVNADIAYVPTEAQEIKVTYKGTAAASFTNILKKWTATVTKADAETGEPQSDATLSGAVYGIYDKEGNLLDTYTTENGSFITKEYACGDYTLKEIEPSEGYTLDETVYPVGAGAGNFVTEHNSLEITVKEQAVKGSISIIKHTDNGDTQIETPEEGAAFEVWLKSAGSYGNAAETERDLLICDEYGFAQTKGLPYGVYTVHQTGGWPDTEYMADFDVYIAKDGKVMRYLINNKAFESYLKIVKLDAETGNTVPVAGAGYKLYDADGDPVTMRFTYPQITVIDTFYTNEEGFLITPEKLGYGEYTLVECQAPYGYILDPGPVKFTMDLAHAEENGGILTVTVSQEDKPQKGVISIIKLGEYLKSFAEKNGVYEPVYASGTLPGAAFDIIAAEEIRGGDGSVKYEAGAVADTVATDEEGRAVSKELPLGKYIIKETKAPEGYVLNGGSCEIELSYAGETVEITQAGTEISNERQKAVISLKKLLEAEDGEATAADITKVKFGLFAAAGITAADGSILPADGLLESAYVNEDGTLAFKTDIPFGSYYVKELATAEGYILDGTEYRFDFSYAGEEIPVVGIDIKDGEAIINIPEPEPEKPPVIDVPTGDRTPGKRVAAYIILGIIIIGIIAANIIFKKRRK